VTGEAAAPGGRDLILNEVVALEARAERRIGQDEEHSSHKAVGEFRVAAITREGICQVQFGHGEAEHGDVGQSESHHSFALVDADNDVLQHVPQPEVAEFGILHSGGDSFAQALDGLC